MKAKQSKGMLWAFFLCSFSFYLCTGCAWNRWNLFASAPQPPQPADTLVLCNGRLEPEKSPLEIETAKKLAGAHELFRKEKYAEAEKVFHKLAENEKNPPQIAEEARYYEAECLRCQGKYPKAADTYNQMLKDFRGGIYKDQALQHMFNIANYWLDDTRKEWEAQKNKRNNGSWFAWPGPFVHFEKSKPLLDEEGRAFEKLEQVFERDPRGKLAAEALFLMGNIRLFRGDYDEADFYFSQFEHYPDSPHAPEALVLAVISKQLSTGGSDYDGRKVAEARKLIEKVRHNYPEAAIKQVVNKAGKSENFLIKQLASVDMQQAEKDFKTAEFYRRTGHPGSAYFYYEIVRRRYPHCKKYFEKATERMHELRAEAEKEGKPLPPIEPSQSAPKTEPQPEQLHAPQKLPAIPSQDLKGPTAPPASGCH